MLACDGLVSGPMTGIWTARRWQKNLRVDVNVRSNHCPFPNPGLRGGVSKIV